MVVQTVLQSTFGDPQVARHFFDADGIAAMPVYQNGQAE
jgi:hypothetical protein